MSRKIKNRFIDIDKELVDQRRDFRNLNEFIELYRLCFSSTPGTVEYMKLMCVLYEGLGHFLNASNYLLTRLLKSTRFLLHQKSVMVIQDNNLPDLLRDVTDSPKGIFSYCPNVIPTIAGVSLRCSCCARQPYDTVAENSSQYRPRVESHDFSMDQAHNQSRNINHSNNIIDTIILRAQNNDNNLLSANQICQSQQNIRLNRTVNKMNINYSQSDNTKQRRFHIQNAITTNDRHNEINNIQTRCMMPELVVTRLSSRYHPHEHLTHGLSFPTHIGGRESHCIEHDLTRDIVYALRTLGDNLDTRMRIHNETSIQSLFAAMKLSSSLLILSTVKQTDVLVAVCNVFMEFAHQYIHL